MCISEEVEGRVFIVGCPRSGTTLVQGMIGAHPKVLTFPETHFFSMAFPSNRLKRLITWPALNVQGILAEFLKEIDRLDLLEDAKVSAFTDDYVKPFVNILDRLTLEAKRVIWAEKTPKHLHFIDEISQRVPRSKFIHVIRDGVDVVASLYKITNEKPRQWTKGRRPGFRGFTVAECIRRWNHDVSISARYRHSEHHLLMRYETLVEDPEPIMREVSEFLAINFVPQMLSPEKVFDQIVGSDEAWKGNNARPIHRPTSKFEQIFTPQIQRQIREELDVIDF